MTQIKLAKDLLAIGAIQIRTEEYFTWTSGIRSPIYCDNRLTMSYPSIRKNITNMFIEMIETMDVRPDVIAACATAGIPHAAWLSNELDLPMIYVRSKPKAHGKENRIEGFYQEKQNILVIEDLISTGNSSIETANVLRAKGLNVLGIKAIFSYDLQQAYEQFQKEGLFYESIISFVDILRYLVEEKSISEDERSELLTWRDNRVEKYSNLS